MFGRMLVLGLSAVLVTAVAAAGGQLYDEKADAHEQIAAAVRQASKRHQNVVLDFGGNWCGDCHALEAAMRRPELAELIDKSYVVVHIDVGRFNKNLDLAQKYGVPLEKGVPALAVLDSKGNLLYAQARGEFEDARRLSFEDIKAFFEKWKPKR